MAATFRAYAAGTVIAAALSGVAPVRAADSVERLRIELVVVDHANVPKQVLSRANSEAARIFGSFGITVVWTDEIKRSVGSRIVVNLVSKPDGRIFSAFDGLAAKSADSRVLGVAPGHIDRRELAVWAFYDRILDTSGMLGLDTGVLLGHVVAHELGHLLLPYDSHSQTGLMRPGWDKWQAVNAAMGILRFDPGQSGLIRRTASKLLAGR